MQDLLGASRCEFINNYCTVKLMCDVDCMYSLLLHRDAVQLLAALNIRCSAHAASSIASPPISSNVVVHPISTIIDSSISIPAPAANESGIDLQPMGPARVGVAAATTIGVKLSESFHDWAFSADVSDRRIRRLMFIFPSDSRLGGGRATGTTWVSSENRTNVDGASDESGFDPFDIVLQGWCNVI
jgi:hypothetical protein